MTLVMSQATYKLVSTLGNQRAGHGKTMTGHHMNCWNTALKLTKLQRDDEINVSVKAAKAEKISQMA